MNKAKGFTLLEIMVVLVIIAIVISIAVVSLAGFGRTAQLKSTVGQLKSLVKTADAEAIFMPAILGLRFSKNGYQFYRYVQSGKGAGAWKKLNNDPLSHAVEIPPLLQVTYLQPGHKKEGTLPNQPQIIFSPSGDMTPFRLKIQIKGETRAYYIIGHGSGGVSVKETNNGKTVTVQEDSK